MDALATTMLMFDSETLWEIIRTFIPLRPITSKILAALPGFPTMLAPATVITATSLTSATAFTTFFA